MPFFRQLWIFFFGTTQNLPRKLKKQSQYIITMAMVTGNAWTYRSTYREPLTRMWISEKTFCKK